MDVVVHIGMALLCFAQQCHPVLVGKNTPIGEFTMNQRIVVDPAYGGSVMQFKIENHDVYAIHKVWLGKPSENRSSRMKSQVVSDRVITNGCINVSDDVYNELLVNYQGSRLVIKK